MSTPIQPPGPNNNVPFTREQLAAHYKQPLEAITDDRYQRFMDLYNTNKSGLIGDLKNKIMQGGNSAMAGVNMAAGSVADALGMEGVAQGRYDAAAEDFVDAQSYATDPDLEKRINHVLAQPGFMDTVKALGADPKATAALVAQSLPGSIGSVAAAVPAGRAASAALKGGQAALTAGFAGLGSGVQEYGSTILQTLAEAGVDVRDGKQIAEYMTDPDIGPELKKVAILRGVPVAAFDALSFSLAGKFLPNGKLTVPGALKETGVQAAAGMAGEAGAQKLSTGKVDDMNAIALEGALEAATGVPQAVFQPAYQNFVGGNNSTTNVEQMVRQRLGADKATGEAAVIEDAPSDIAAPVVPGSKLATDKLSKKTQEKLDENPIANEVKVSAPKEILRGTPKQMRSRLNNLTKDEVIGRAKEFAGFDVKDFTEADGRTLTKKDLITKILNKYGIDETKDEVQTPKSFRAEKVEFTPTTNSTANTQPSEAIAPEVKPVQMTPEMENISKKDREALVQAAETPNAPQAVKDGAKAWLSGLPDLKAAQENLTNVAGNKAFDQDGLRTEKLNSLAQHILNPRTNPENVAKHLGDFIDNLRGNGFFTPTEAKTLNAMNPELESYYGETHKVEPETFRAMVQSSPSIRKGVLATAFDAFRKNPKAFDKYPALKNALSRANKAVDAAHVVKAPVTPQSAPQAPQQVQENTANAAELTDFEARQAIVTAVDSIPDELFRESKYNELTPDAYHIAPTTSLFGKMMKNLDYTRSMASLSRKYEWFAPIYNYYRERDAFRHTTIQTYLQEMQAVVERFGVKKADAALDILDVMTRPGQEPQLIHLTDDGKLLFKDKAGQMKLADPQTAQAVKAFQGLFKMDIGLKQQAILTKIAEEYGFDPRTMSRFDLNDLINGLKGTGQDTKAKKLESTLQVLDNLDTLFKSNRAYFPHRRNRGPFALATYTQNAKGEYELAGLYSIKDDGRGNIDREDEKMIRERIQKDQDENGIKFYTSNGMEVSTATPFRKTANTLRDNIMKNAKDPALAYEALSSLLTQKGINPEDINQVFKDLELGNDIEKLFVSLRDRKGYYGYDNEDRLSSMVDHLMAQSSTLTTFKYRTPISKAFAEAKTKLAQNRADSSRLTTMLDKYQSYMTDPAEEWANLRSLNFWYFLAGNPSTAALQLMSTYTNTLPWLGQYVNVSDFAKANLQSLSNLGKVSRVMANTQLLNKQNVKEFAKLINRPVEDANVILNLRNDGILDPGYAIEAVGDVNVNNFGQTGGRKTGWKPVKAVADIAGAMIQVPENIARINSALLVLDTLRNPQQMQKIATLLYKTDPLFKNLVNGKYNGVVTKEAIIRHAIDENHGVFGKTSRAPFMRGGIGAVAFPFLTYPIQMLEQMGRLMTQRGPRGVAAMSLMALVYPILFGGLMSVPGYTTWDWATKWFNKLAKEKNTNLEIEINRALSAAGFDDNLRRTLLSGAVFNDTFGIEASQRIGNQFWFQPFLDFFLNPGSSQSQANPQFLGGASSLMQGMQGTMSQMAEGDNFGSSALQNLAPMAVRNLAKSAELYEGNLESSKGDRLLPKEGMPGFDYQTAAFKRAIGFTDNAVSQAQKYKFQRQILDDAYQDGYSGYGKKLGRYTEDMYRAKVKGDRDAYKEAAKGYASSLRELIEFNAKTENPKTRYELVKMLKGTVTDRAKRNLNPLQAPKQIDKDRRARKDADLLAVPEIAPYVTDRPRSR